MRKQPQIEARYWADSFPVDLCIALGCGIAAGLLTLPLAYHSSMHYLAHAHTLDPGSHHIASIFLALFLSLAATFATSVVVFLIRYFRRLYRKPL